MSFAGKEADAMKAWWRRIEAEHAGDSDAFAKYCYEESIQLIEMIRDLPAEFNIPYFAGFSYFVLVYQLGLALGYEM